MADLSAVWTGAPPPVSWDRELADDGRVNSYLTDGVELYRWLGLVRRGWRRVVGLENCRSLEIILVSTREFRRLRRLPPQRLG